MNVSNSRQISNDPTRNSYDVVVLGSGASGLATALFCSLRGLGVLVVEESQYIGGTSALSGGTTWAPLSKIGRQVNHSDSMESVTQFLDQIIGNDQKPQRDHFLQQASQAIEELENKTDVHFRPCPKHPDYVWTNSNATLNGRAIEPIPFSTRGLGKLREYIRPPIPEFTVLGGMQIDRIDIGNLLNRFKSFSSFVYVARLVMRYAFDTIVFGRHTRVVMGQALIARLLQSCLKNGVEFVTKSSVIELSIEKQVVRSFVLQTPSQRKRIETNALVSATGGAGQNPSTRKHVYPSTLSPYSPANPDNKGSFHDLLKREGVEYGRTSITPAFYAPVSIKHRDDGTTAVYPHFVFDRSKPGTICVNGEGKRFINETVSYHDFGKTVLDRGDGDKPIWLISDSSAAKKYGLGLLRPGGDDPARLIANGYLKRGETIAELADLIDVDAAVLESTIKHYNMMAESGVDEDFGRGTTEYQRHNGDQTHQPNPTMRSLVSRPFYAVRLFIGDIGSSIGFGTTIDGQIIGSNGDPFTNLYAAGGDMLSVMAGHYPGPGITIGPGITFGYIVANHIHHAKRTAR